MKILELFSGVGATTRALKNIGIEITEHYSAEWNVDSIIANALLNFNIDDVVVPDVESYLGKFTFSLDTKKPSKLNSLKIDRKELLAKANVATNNFGSIMDIDHNIIPKLDLLTYSFPCQDISVMGDRNGFSKNSNTRSSLLWEVGSLIEKLCESGKPPEYLLMENVTAIDTKTHRNNYHMWISYLASFGYSNESVNLNSANFGSAQSRPRTFLVSKLNGSVPNITKIRDNQKVFSDINTKPTTYKIPNINLEKVLCSPLVVGRASYYFVESFSSFIRDSQFYMNEGAINTVVKCGCVPKVVDGDIIRYVTTEEIMLLSGYESKDYRKLSQYIKDNKIKEMMGNTIVVNVLESIFRDIFIDKQQALFG